MSRGLKNFPLVVNFIKIIIISIGVIEAFTFKFQSGIVPVNRVGTESFNALTVIAVMFDGIHKTKIL